MSLPKHCLGCPFKSRTACSSGDPKARVVIIGEGPGKEELKKGIPFVGPSGHILWETLRLNRDECYVMNASNCYPWKESKRQGQILQGKKKNAAKTKIPTQEMATAACRSRVLEEIKSHPRDLIICLGNHATHSVTGNTGLKITQIRGALIKSPLAKIGILPALHPAALLRGTGSYRQFANDMQYARDLLDGKPPKQPVVPKWYVIDSEEKAERVNRLLALRAKAGEALNVAADIETSGFDRIDDYILCIGIAYRSDIVFIYDAEHLHFVKPLLESKAFNWIWHNGKFDTAFLRAPATNIQARVDDDTMLMSYTIESRSGIHDLEQLQKDYLGAPNYKAMLDEYTKSKGMKKGSYARVPKPVLHHYLALDVSGTLQIYTPLKELVQSKKPHRVLYNRVLIPASEMLRRVEERGFFVDIDKVMANNERLGKITEEAQTVLHEIAGFAINPNSPAQLSDFMYNTLRLPNRHGGSTGKDILEKLPQVPFVKALQEFRKAAKAHSTFVTALLGTNKKKGHIKEDGRVHSTYKLHVTPTGRLASSEPNLQNIPRDKQLRSMYRAAPGYVLMEFDLSQAELRSLATLSGDPTLVAIYCDSERSLHKEFCTSMWGADYTDDQYAQGKMVNFGIVYGRTAPSIAEQFAISIAEAQEMIDHWANEYPLAWAYIQKCRMAPVKGLTIQTCFGRRKTHQIVSPERIRDYMNEAANFPHQSIASDITLTSAITVQPILESWGCHIVNLVHDSIITEVPLIPKVIEDTYELVINTLQETPRKWGIVTVPFKADCKIGTNWGLGKETKKPLDALKDFNL